MTQAWTRHVSTGFSPGGVVFGASAASVDFRVFERCRLDIRTMLTRANTNTAPNVPKVSTAISVEFSITSPFTKIVHPTNASFRDPFPRAFWMPGTSASRAVSRQAGGLSSERRRSAGVVTAWFQKPGARVRSSKAVIDAPPRQKGTPDE